MGNRSILTLAGLVALLLVSSLAEAVPSFTRQTQLDCATCHSVFPQLTPFGRQFKLSAYTTASGPFSDQGQQGKRLSEDVMAPLSAMLLVNYTTMQEKDSGVNGNKPKATVEFPQEFSVFYAGRISNYLGAFAQMTLDSANEIAMDNVDVRYARTSTQGGTTMVYGLSLNNSPTGEDIYNTTPVWGFPFVSSEYANTPDFGTLLGKGAFAQTTAGAVVYAMVNNHWYGAAGWYHDTQAGATPAAGLSGWAPYLRVAYESQLGSHNGSLGGFAMAGDYTRDVTAPVASNTARFQDLGADFQYQYLQGVNTLTLRANYLHEKLEDAVNIGASQNTLYIHSASANAEYYYNRTYGAALGLFRVQGRPDSSYTYTSMVTSGTPEKNGSLDGTPDSAGWLAELNYVPWLNTKFSVQYTAYSKFDGGDAYTSGNTGERRSANANNTLYLSAWYLF